MSGKKGFAETNIRSLICGRRPSATEGVRVPPAAPEPIALAVHVASAASSSRGAEGEEGSQIQNIIRSCRLPRVDHVVLTPSTTISDDIQCRLHGMLY